MNALVVLSALVAVASAQYFNGLHTNLAYSGLNAYATPYTSYTGYATPYAGYATPYAGYATPYAGHAGYAAPYSYASTYHSQDELGQASYGHSQADQSHAAVRDAFGNVAGGYSYISPEGKPITVRYTAGVNGFQVESNALPVAPVDTGVAPVDTGVAPVYTGVAPVYTGVAPLSVEATPEVKAATAEHLAAVEEAKSRSKRSLLYSAPLAPYTNALPYSSAVAYSNVGYPAELTEVILNPGHAYAYNVQPLV